MTLVFPFENLTISAVQAEMINAIAKHGIDKTPLNPTMSNEVKLVVLVEEVGEIARALTYDNGGSKNALIRELLQTAAMALAWAQSLDSTT
jgi:NTP pyrophosphatase (non-canonical NTP hydrolase)